MDSGHTELEGLLDRVAELRGGGKLDPVPDAISDLADPVAKQVARLLEDRQLRPEHRARIYEDLERNREFLQRLHDPRLVDIIYWSEQVERLYTSLRRGRLETFHYVRALEATCRRCGFELLPVMGKMEELGKVWGGRDLAATHALFSPDLIQVDPARETAPELGPQE